MDKLGLDETVQRVLISTTSRLVGDFASEAIKIDHAWPDVYDNMAMRRFDESPVSRNAYVISFITNPKDPKDVIIPNYGPVGELLCSFMSVLYGKRFDSHGLIEGSGYFALPNLTAYSQFVDHRLPFNSHSPRKDSKISLNLKEMVNVVPLLYSDKGVNKHLTEVFRVASKFYLRALQNFELDSEIAYLNLITAAEVVSNYCKYDVNELIDEEFRSILEAIETNIHDGKRYSKMIKNRLSQVKKRLVKTIVELVDDDFFDGSEAMHPCGMLKQGDFEKRVAAAYDLRSKYVHNGSSFGAWISLRASTDKHDIQCGRPIIGDKDFEKILYQAPTFLGLERIIRYCLLKLLDNNGVKLSSQTQK